MGTILKAEHHNWGLTTMFSLQSICYELNNDGISNNDTPDDEPKVKLRDFTEFPFGEGTLSVQDNKIHYTKPVILDGIIRLYSVKNKEGGLSMNELQIRIVEIFKDSPDMIFGFTDISYSDFGKEFKSGLVFAVPYTQQLSLNNYNEKAFHEGILGAKGRLEDLMSVGN